MSVLEVKGLRTYYKTLNGFVKAVDGVSFDVKKGEALGLVGESGCGKTTTALSVLKLLPTAGKIVEGSILLNGDDLVPKNQNQMRKIRWKGISVVFQGAMNAFNPVFRIGEQIVEAIRLHEPGVSRQEAFERAGELLEIVGIERSRITSFPHEFSGGMRQRALIAMAISCSPQLLIADEPGTALDVIVQAQVLKVLKDLKERLDLSMILITHDLSIVAETCEKLAIMYAGKVVEYGKVEDIFSNPLHPYTKGLLGAFPKIKEAKTRLVSIPGTPPDLLSPPPACRFNTRCPFVMDICRKVEPELMIHGKTGQLAACHLYS